MEPMVQSPEISIPALLWRKGANTSSQDCAVSTVSGIDLSTRYMSVKSWKVSATAGSPTRTLPASSTSSPPFCQIKLVIWNTPKRPAPMASPYLSAPSPRIALATARNSVQFFGGALKPAAFSMSLLTNKATLLVYQGSA